MRNSVMLVGCAAVVAFLTLGCADTSTPMKTDGPNQVVYSVPGMT
jgi:hypothetical protein